MARFANATQINLGSGDPACKFLDFRVAVRPGNLPGKCCDLFSQGCVGIYRRRSKRAEARSRPSDGGRACSSGPCWPEHWRGSP
jgi:hypothetical protein